MIKSIILVRDNPLDVVILDWQNMSRKKLYEHLRAYESFGYIALVNKVLHIRGVPYRKVVYGANETKRLIIKS